MLIHVCVYTQTHTQTDTHIYIHIHTQHHRSEVVTAENDLPHEQTLNKGI